MRPPGCDHLRIALLALALVAFAPAAARAQLAPEPPQEEEEPARPPEPETPAEAPIDRKGLEARQGVGKVSEIKVEGNRRVETEAVKSALITRVGMGLDRERVREDIKALWKLGFFSDVEILVDDAKPDAIVMVVKVTEKPAVRVAKVRGNKELSDDDLKDIVDIKPFSILDMAAVRRNSKKLQDKYVEKGYFLAEVSYQIEPAEENEVDVFFDVNEHAKVQVKRITFAGNEHVPDADLKEVMQTEEGNFFSFITSAGTYREEVFQRDLAMIQGVYYDRGFIHVKVGTPKVSLTPDKKYIYVSIPISEGEQYSIGKIDFAGDLLRPKPELRERMSVNPGEVFNRTKLQRDILALTDVYHDEGYAYANINPQTMIDPEKRIVDLTFDIQKGEKIYIERIEIVGNHKTRDKVIRRELRIYEGELFSGTGIRNSRARVTALGFFESVDVTYKKGASDTTVVMTVSVKEKPTGTFQVGFGFSSIENFIFTAQVSQNNLAGWGQTASLSAQISSLRTLIQLSFIDPYFLDTNWIFNFDYYRQDLDYFRFLRRANGGDLGFGYHLSENVLAQVAYMIEAVSVEQSSFSPTQDILLANRFRSGLTSALRGTLTWDRRDNRLFPSDGWYETITLEHSPPWLGATFNFTRVTLNSRYYQPIAWGIVAKGQATLGYIDGKNLPISEMYFAGGIMTLRGYQLRSIAPTVRIGSEGSPNAPLTPFPVGGNKQLLVNLELEFPIFEKVGIRGVAFYDTGNVYAEDEAFFQPKGTKLPLGMLHSVGVGFRWFSPIGPLRFEWGFPLTPRLDAVTGPDQSSSFEFTIGNFF